MRLSAIDSQSVTRVNTIIINNLLLLLPVMGKSQIFNRHTMFVLHC